MLLPPFPFHAVHIPPFATGPAVLLEGNEKKKA